MKRLILTVCLFCFFLRVFAQGYEVTFSKINNIEKTLKYYEETYKDQNPNIKEEVSAIAQFESVFRLNYLNGKSKYEEINFDKEEFKELSFGKVNIVFAKSQKRPTAVYKNFSEGLYFQKIDIFNRDYLVKDSLLFGKWEILEDEKLIGELKCKKAVFKEANYEAEAWFALDIPIPDGPEFYSGLPGLIIELKTKNFYYRVLSIKRSEFSLEFDDFSKTKILTRKEFFDLENDKVYQFKKMMEEGG